MRNKAIGFLVSGWAAGGLLAAAAYAPIVTAWGWRGLFFVGIAPALLTIYVRFSVPEPAEWQASRGEEVLRVPFFSLFSKRWLPISLGMFAVSFASFATTILSLIPTYLKSESYDPGEVGALMFVASFGALLGYWASGFLGDRLGTRRAIVLGMGLSLAFVATTILAAAARSLVLGISLLLVEFTSLGITGVLPKYIADHFDVRAAAHPW